MKRLTQRKRWKGIFKWNELEMSKGGMGRKLISLLKSYGILAYKSHSPYVGRVGIDIEICNKKEAIKVAKIMDFRNIDFLKPLIN